jgi:L-ascorbate metabolism protein UlaG (beta-lactamase superfamily)
MDNLNILTDPIWSKRCGPFGITGLKRVSAPGVRFEDLPPIDIVLVSHNHYDHMDIPTLKMLRKVHNPLFCVSLGNKEKLEKKGFTNIYEFNWWEQQTLTENLKVTYVPGQHFSRRGLWDRNKTLWGGFILEGSQGPIYFAGDTGYGAHFKQIHEKFGPLNFAILPIGAYQPEWFMSSVHMSPEDAVRAHLVLEAKASLAIHFGTFRLGDEAIDQPVEQLVIAMEKYGITPDQFWVLKPGEGRDVKI